MTQVRNLLRDRYGKGDFLNPNDFDLEPRKNDRVPAMSSSIFQLIAVNSSR